MEENNMEEMSLDTIFKNIPSREEAKKLCERDISFIIRSLSYKLEELGYNTTSTFTSDCELKKSLDKKKITQEEYNKIWELIRYYFYICEIGEKFIPLVLNKNL